MYSIFIKNKILHKYLLCCYMYRHRETDKINIFAHRSVERILTDNMVYIIFQRDLGDV